MKVGFVGLGQMGSRMAINVFNKLKQKPDFEFFLYDINTKSSQSLLNQCQSQKVKAMPNVTELVKRLDHPESYLITMLPKNDHVLECYLGSNGVIETTSNQNLICVDSSTVAPKVIKTIVEEGEKKQLFICDAPVSGGVLGAEKGTLTFMLGASDSEMSKVKPLLSLMGQSLIACGKRGDGQIAKICNNLLLAISMLGTSETMHLGERLGIDPKILFEVLRTSTGRNWSLDTYNPVPGILPNVPSSRQYEGGFNIQLMLKDVGLAMDCAKETSSTCLLGGLSKEIYNQVSNTTIQTKDGEKEMAKMDFSVVYQWLDQNWKRHF